MRARYVPHIGATFGYRVEFGGHSVAYISDHQQPLDGESIASEVLELADGADLLIHDAQYTPEEFALKSHWGHCTIDYALHVAREAGVRRWRSSTTIRRTATMTSTVCSTGARLRGAELGLTEVIAAAEGLTVSFARRRSSRSVTVRPDDLSRPQRCR